MTRTSRSAPREDEAAAHLEEVRPLERDPEGDAESAGQVAIAEPAAGEQEPGGAGRRFTRRLAEQRHRLERVGDLLAGQPEVPVPSLSIDRQQAAGDKPLQVKAGRLGAMRAIRASSLAGRACPSISESNIVTRDGSLTSSPKLATSKRESGRAIASIMPAV